MKSVVVIVLSTAYNITNKKHKIFVPINFVTNTVLQVVYYIINFG